MSANRCMDEIDEKTLDSSQVTPVAYPQGSNDLYEAEQEYPPGHELYIDPKEEARIVRKLDLLVSPIVMILYIVCALDRGNIGNVAAAGMPAEIGLKGNQLNTAVSIYFATYVAFEVPVTMLTRSFPPNRILPVFILTWAGIMVWSGYMKSYGELISTRLLIGMCESGLYPFMNVYLSSLYKRQELPLRTLPLYLSTLIAGAIGGLICTGLVKMNGVAGKSGWRWIYLMEAILSVAVAVLVFFGLPANAQSAWFFTEREKELVRIRERQRATFMGNPKLNRRDIFNILKDPKVFIAGAIQFCICIPTYGVGTFMPVIISTLGPHFSGIYAQLMTVPVYTFACVAYLGSAYIMHKTRRRWPIILSGCVISGLGFIVILALGSGHPGAKYAMVFLCVTGVQLMNGSNLITLQSNQAPQVKRSVAMAINQSMGNTGGAVAGQLFRATDKPNYPIGHGTSLGVMVLGFCICTYYWRYLVSINRKRDAMSPDDRQALIDAGATGDLHPDFRLVY